MNEKSTNAIRILGGFLGGIIVVLLVAGSLGLGQGEGAGVRYLRERFEALEGNIADLGADIQELRGGLERLGAVSEGLVRIEQRIGVATAGIAGISQALGTEVDVGNDALAELGAILDRIESGYNETVEGGVP